MNQNKKQIKFNIRTSTLEKSLHCKNLYNNNDISVVVDRLILEFLNNTELRERILKL